MTKSVTVHYAKTNLSRLLADVEAGVEVIISRGKAPVAKLVSLQPEKPIRVAGRLKGILKVSEDFWDPLPAEELELWYRCTCCWIRMRSSGG